MALEYFCCYHSYRKKLAKLSDQEVGRLFRSLLEYSETGETQELTGRESVAFDFISDDIDRAKDRYSEKCRINRENANERNRLKANASDRKRTIPNDSESSQNKNKDKDKTKNKNKDDTFPFADAQEKVSGARGRTRFTPPTVDEVRAYCQERQNGVDPERFVDFYASKGWMVGKNKMADWKSCVRTWERRQEPSAQPPAKKSFSEIAAEMAKRMEDET